jgi:predicted metal-dependent peptidase
MAVPDLKTCAVGLTPEGHYKFLWDAEWFEKQSRPLQILVVLHEVAHLVLQHLERGLRIRLRLADPKRYAEIHEIVNVAMDMAANDTVIRPFVAEAGRSTYGKESDRLAWPEQRKYPQGETFEEYLARLLKDLEKDGWEPGCGKPFPNWLSEMIGNSPTSSLDPVINMPVSDLTDAEIERIISTANTESKQLVKNAIEQTQRSRGTVPAHLKSWIDDLFLEPKVPWPQIFRGYLKTSLSSKLAESSAYPNPALFHLAIDDGIEPYTGYQKEFTFNMAILIDSSGSISSDDYETFIGELQGIAQAERGATATLIYFDAAVQHVEQLDLDPEKFKSHYRYSYGGTDFNPPFQYILGRDTRVDASVESLPRQMKRWDVVIILTDGEAPIESPGGPCPESLPPCPVIWVLVGNRDPHPAMGSRIVKLE